MYFYSTKSGNDRNENAKQEVTEGHHLLMKKKNPMVYLSVPCNTSIDSYTNLIKIRVFSRRLYIFVIVVVNVHLDYVSQIIKAGV